ncbi:unnamed protein product [Rotaria magnacalcarata]|uniref:Saccharopine dehydrogenase (NAD(+), L-glutamate-forming) n=2 Tax=Rotaria magnacalcarata TaxID=392030 RepID=A0A816Z431_9BILA|nr:unnamed protein product [Rotaria magnacalcarata]CAF2184847.1 unnamed protein product [Rotaria magnacalcarata]CAF3795605.1 unnamed protein product [Rotaria magnacalcarata]CAF3839273.1 unnamed protein product [Rotaria magnacalcarata]
MFLRPGLKSHSLLRVASSYPSRSKHVIAIRREDQSPWERRSPIAPEHVRQLVQNHKIKVLIQPSNRRAFPISSFVQAGAIAQEDLSEASVIMGVKQVPIDALLPNKVYVMFSHTHKAQEDNMALLDACLEKNVTLVDYEKIVDDEGVRLVAFGKYAGVVGMINILHGLGLRFLALGHHTPFMHIGPAHNYRNNEQVRMAIRDAGYEIALGLMPKSIGPLTVVFTGAGNVSQGAQEVFRELPIEYVDTKSLPQAAKHGATNKIYGCVVQREDHLINKETGLYSEAEYLEYPDRYISTFNTQIAPYASCIINGIYWEPTQPKLLRIGNANQLLTPPPEWTQNDTRSGCPTLPHRLLAICDITADKCGSIEIVQHITTIDHPFLLYNPKTNTSTESFDGSGVLVCSIDNMPTQLPLEATTYFGSKLLPLIPKLLEVDATKNFQMQTNVPRVIRDATLTANGQLTPKYSYITQLREQRRLKTTKSSSEKRVLVLGAGFVSGPVIEYLTRNEQINVTVVSAIKQEADRFAATNSRVTPVLLDVTRSESELNKLVKEHDCVVSLLPFGLHPNIAALCIKNRRHMITTSYVSPKMKSLHDEALAAGVTLLNEVGLDPGIDHMLAMELFDLIRDDGGRIDSYVSYCGGLPAPEHADNPLRYKFSWSPRGALIALLNPAKYLLKSKIVQLEANGGVIENGCTTANFLPGFNLECYPNRDSTTYIDSLQLDTVHTILRGTLRYKGFCQNVLGLIRLGLLNDNPHPSLQSNDNLTWKQFMCDLLSLKRDTPTNTLRSVIHQKLQNDNQLQTIEQLGLLSEDVCIEKRSNPLDTLSNWLAKRLTYGPNERDIVILHHQVGVTWPSVSRTENELKTIDMVIYGDQKHSAMAKTVGLPAAIATRMLLDNEIYERGVVVPLKRTIYKPILNELQREGITWSEKTVKK